jgi:hypothetical protein
MKTNNFLSKYLPPTTITMLFGNSKVGKSKLAIDLAFCVATGNSCFLEQKTKQGKVLIISSDSLQSLRHSLARRGFSPENAENIRFILRWGIDEIGLLVTQLEDFQPDLLIIDCLSASIHLSEASCLNLSKLASDYQMSLLFVSHLGREEPRRDFIPHLGWKNNRNEMLKLSSSCNSCWWELSSSAQDSKKRIFSVGGGGIKYKKLNLKFNAEDYSFSLIKKVGKTKSVEEFRQLFETLYQQD